MLLLWNIVTFSHGETTAALDLDTVYLQMYLFQLSKYLKQLIYGTFHFQTSQTLLTSMEVMRMAKVNGGSSVKVTWQIDFNLIECSLIQSKQAFLFGCVDCQGQKLSFCHSVGISA